MGIDSGHGRAIISNGEVAERLNAADSKSVLGSHLTGVRIPPSPLPLAHVSHPSKSIRLAKPGT